MTRISTEGRSRIMASIRKTIIRASGNGIYNNTNGFLIGAGATIQPTA